MSPAKTAEPIEMPFGLWTGMGPSNNVLRRVPGPPSGRGKFGGDISHPIVKYMQTLRTITLKR